MARPTVAPPRPIPPVRATTPALDPAFWLAALGSVVIGLGARGTLAGLLLGAALVVHPGTLVVEALRPGDRLERAATTIAVSLVTWSVVAHLLLTLQWWHPAGTAALLLAICAAVRLAQVVERSPASRPHGAGRAMLTDTAGGARRTLRSIGKGHMIATTFALALWTWSMTRLDVSDIGFAGLVGTLPLTWFAAFAVLVVAAAVAATAPRPTVARVVLGVGSLIVTIYGTIALSTGTVRYPWSYKHIGVMRLLDETGRFHPDVDIYNNFSGFFGLGAFHRGATGVDPTSYAAWAQVGGEALVLVAVCYLVLRITASTRVTYLAAVLYVLTNWVGQNYFAAQTLGSFLAITTLAMVWAWFRTSLTPPPRHVRNARRAVTAATFLGLLMVHPLTPVIVIGPVAVAYALKRVRDRPLLMAFVGVTVLWIARTFTYFAAQSFDLGFGGSPTANAGGNAVVGAPPALAELIGAVTRAFSLGVWVLALVGGVAAAWARRRVGLVVVLAMVPFGIPLVQSYGGEAIYRVYLYSLPLMCALIAWGVVSRTPVVRRTQIPQPTVLASVLCLGLAAGMVVVHFGRERINQVESSEVAMEQYIDATIEGPAILAQFGGSYPAQSTARYPEFQVTDTYTPHIVEMVGDSTVLPSPDVLDDVADDLVALTAGTPYVVVSPGMIDEIRTLGTFPVADTAAATAFLLGNDRFRLVARIDDTYLLAVSR